MDTLNININQNKLAFAEVKGGLQLPIMSGIEVMPYRADIQRITSDLGTIDYDILFEAIPKEVDISLLQSKIIFDENSSLTFGRKNGEYLSPKIDMSGKISFEIAAETSSLATEIQEAINQIESFASAYGVTGLIPNLNCESIDFNDLKIDFNPSVGDDIFSIGEILPQGLEIDFLGTTSNLSTVNFLDLNPEELVNNLGDELKTKVNELLPVEDLLGLSFETKLAEDVLDGLAPTAVSYTHLTLPTICSV